MAGRAPAVASMEQRRRGSGSRRTASRGEDATPAKLLTLRRRWCRGCSSGASARRSTLTSTTASSIGQTTAASPRRLCLRDSQRCRSDAGRRELRRRDPQRAAADANECRRRAQAAAAAKPPISSPREHSASSCRTGTVRTSACRGIAASAVPIRCAEPWRSPPTTTRTIMAKLPIAGHSEAGHSSASPEPGPRSRTAARSRD